MGGEFQDMRVKCSEKDLKKVYSKIVDTCAWERGHGGYSGTFAEKPTIHIIQPHEGKEFWQETDAREDAMDNNDKWGPSFAYKVGKNEWLIAGWCSA